MDGLSLLFQPPLEFGPCRLEPPRLDSLAEGILDRNAESQAIRWLHLSDFHVGKDAYAQRLIFRRIHRHVREVVNDKGAPDLVFITGDLSQSGKEQEYATFYEDFLRPLVEVLGDDWDGSIYTIPGNHDVDRHAAQYFDRKKICQPSSIFFDADRNGLQQRKPVLARFRAYIHAETEGGSNSTGGWLASKAGAFSERREIRGRSLGIVGVNTAWLCQGDDDRHKLSPGFALVEEALRKVRSCEVRIVLGHHPLDWLHDDDLESISALLGEYHALYLHGHLHRNQGQRIYGAGQSFLAVQAGACFQARDGEPWINGLLWAELDLDHHELRLQPRDWNRRNRDWSLTSGAFPEALRQKGGDWWCFRLPAARRHESTTVTPSAKNGLSARPRATTPRMPTPAAQPRTSTPPGQGWATLLARALPPSIDAKADGGFTVVYKNTTYEIPHSLYVSQSHGRSGDPQHWKRVHTLLERHLRDFTNLQSHIMVCKANAQNGDTQTVDEYKTS